MTDAELAGYVVVVRELEQTARAEWDAIAKVGDRVMYPVAMAAVRQAGSLRRALETWIVTRATERRAGTQAGG